MRDLYRSFPEFGWLEEVTKMVLAVKLLRPGLFQTLRAGVSPAAGNQLALFAQLKELWLDLYITMDRHSKNNLTKFGKIKI